MGVTSILRWQWMVVGLMVGALYGYVRESSADFYHELTSFGARRIGQREFEAALTRQFHGRAQFSDLVVYPYRLAGTGRGDITLHVVSGLYWDGRTEVENGRRAARWEPAYFVASVPYVPVTPGAGASPGTASGRARFDDVMGFLRSPRGGGPVRFQYAWWWWATRPPFVWTCAGFLLIGVVWPTVVNLLAFGTFLRPARAKGPSLWHVKPKHSPELKRADAAALDPAALEALERGLEVALSEAPPPEAPPVGSGKPAIRALRGAAPDEPAAVAGDAKKKDYGAGREDFYPTELGGKHGK